MVTAARVRATIDGRPGYWVHRQGVRRFVPDPPEPLAEALTPEEQRIAAGLCTEGSGPFCTTFCPKCLKAYDAHLETVALGTLAERLERNFAAIAPALEVTFCDCGCALRPGELCPACVRPWMYAAERAGNLASFRREPAA